MDDMVYHCRAVARGLQRPLLMADLPFASYPTRDVGAREFRPPDAGGRRGDGQARERAVADRHRRVPRRPRRRGLRASGPQAPVSAQDRRVPRAGPRRGCRRADDRERQGARVRRRRPRAAGVHPDRARQAHYRGAVGARDRHRRGPGHRRPDPRAVRHPRHHQRPQAALRAQLHGRRGGQPRRDASLRSRRARTAATRRPSTASHDAGRLDRGGRSRPRARVARGGRAHHLRADDGQPPSRPHQPDRTGARAWRPLRRQHLRQPDAVRAERGFQPLSAHAGARRRDARIGRAAI